MENYPEEFVNWLVDTTQLGGYSILLLTVPLAILQSFLGIYPFAALILLNVSAVGLGEGLLASWLMGTLGTIVVYLACDKWLSGWVRNKWLSKMKRYGKYQSYVDRYGIWTIIVLRILPIMPNNLISFMASLSSVRFSQYCWSSVLGMFMHIGLVGLLSSALFAPNIPIWLLAGAYSLICLMMFAVFACQQWVFTSKAKAKPLNPESQSGHHRL